jgi:NADPH:quinone reductase-like Zn-dependent oxidoreductase
VRAVRLHEIGGIPRVDEVPAPAGPDVIRVTASSLNPVDVAIGTGRFYGGTPDTPYVIGSEAVGLTEDGRRLWYYARSTMAERVALAEPDRAVEVPVGVDDRLAIACGTAGLTGWLAVAWRARVTPEDTVLVLGASGTLGATAAQGAKLLGARKVIGAARRVEAVPDAADEVVALDGDYELPEATVVVDGLWGEPAAKALAAAAQGVRFVQLGQSAGASSTLQSAWVRGKMARILGHSLGPTPADVRADGYRELCTHARDGRIRLDVETYELDRIGEAWERQASGSPGVKIVVDLAG